MDTIKINSVWKNLDGHGQVTIIKIENNMVNYNIAGCTAWMTLESFIKNHKEIGSDN